MNAMAVPPSGWNPFDESRPTRASSRRNVGQGLAISGFVHLAALACILWVQTENPPEEIVLTHGSVQVLPPSVDRMLPPPDVVTSPWTPRRGEGIYQPASKVDEPEIELPKVDLRAGISRPGEKPGPGSSTGGGDVLAQVPAVDDPDPVEGAFIAFDEAPVPIVRPDPVYPEWARENGIEGRVLLHALVGVDGRVRRVTTIQGIPGLTESAAEALRRWTFRSAKSNHQPVAVWIEVPFRFRL